MEWIHISVCLHYSPTTSFFNASGDVARNLSGKIKYGAHIFTHNNTRMSHINSTLILVHNLTLCSQILHTNFSVMEVPCSMCVFCPFKVY